MKITDEMVDRAAFVVWQDYDQEHGGTDVNDFRAVSRAALEAALTHPCTCREDVVCGACMSGATDPATATSPTPPADDVREAVEKVHYCPEHGDLLAGTRSLRCNEAHSVAQILAPFEARSHGMATPPVDGVREAVRRGYNAAPGMAVGLVVDSIMAHLAEVRPRGTVTDAEVECPHWSPGSITKRAGCTACAALEAAREAQR